MTLCPRDVTECNAPVTWQRVLQATAVHRNSMRFLSLSLSLSLSPSSSFVPLLPSPLFALPPSPARIRSLFRSALSSLRIAKPRRPVRLAKNGHVIGPAKCQTCRNGRREGRRSPGLLQMTLIAPRRVIAAAARSGGMKDETGYFRGVQARVPLRASVLRGKFHPRGRNF